MFIQQTDLFEGMSKSFMEDLNKFIVTGDYKKGEYLFKAGEPANYFYVLQQGRVRIIVGLTGHTITMASAFESGARLSLRVSFAHPPEVHEVAAQVVWGDEGCDREGTPMRRYGLRWESAASGCVARLRELALRSRASPRTPARGTGPVPRPLPS